jgi:GH35 family endo-1,4-beta-xylanase
MEPKIPESRKEFRERLRAHADAAAERVHEGILKNRMGDGVVRVVDAQNRPVAGAEVSVEQISAGFRFGANAFLLGGFDTPQQNQRWEDLFAELFNLAVVPFFWKDLEPEPGATRYGVESPARYRRPPPDTVLDFCARRGIEPKAHALTYHQFTPDWISKDFDECERQYREHFERVGARFHRKIPSWDVVNEALTRWAWIFDEKMVPRDWVRWSFREAKKNFPGCRLILNEDNQSWEEKGHNHFGFETHPFYLLAQNMLLQGLPVDALGMQYHLFDYKEETLWKRTACYKDSSKLLEPVRLLRALDHYATLGLPLHISEITLPCYGASADDEELQAELAEMLYRTWFSHPAVASIVYWNVVDGHAHGKESELLGALVHKDLSEKAIYRTLRRLIKEEWRTRLPAKPVAEGRLAFRGFHGAYRATVNHGGKTTVAEFELRPGVVGDVLVKM